MLKDIPALCSLLGVQLLNAVNLKDIYIFFIKNKQWEQKYFEKK